MSDKTENPSIVAFDVETTGLPNWKVPSDDPSQPHLVQIGAVRVDLFTREVLETLDVIVKPDGWTIPPETIELHGVTQERAEAEGIDEKEAILKLWDMCARSGFKRAAHNRTFDQRLIRIGMKRYFNQEMMDQWADKEDFTCTLWGSRGIVKAKDNKGKVKLPTLSECIKFFYDEEIEDAHSALPDAMNCMRVYWGIKKHELENA